MLRISLQFGVYLNAFIDYLIKNVYNSVFETQHYFFFSYIPYALVRRSACII